MSATARASAPRRIGFTFVEVIVTMVIVTGFLLVASRLFFGSQRQAAGSEARFSAAVLAQVVAERLRSEVTLNPALLRSLVPPGGKYAVSGRVIPAPPGATDGLPVVPFFEHIFARAASDLYAPENKTGISDSLNTVAALGTRSAGVLDSFRDYKVDVTIEDDEPSEGTNAQLLREMVKRITVKVERISTVAETGSDPAGFTLHTRVLASLENLSTPALDQLYENYESARLDSAYEEFYEQVADNPYFSSASLTPAARDLLADCYIVMGAINTEAYLSDGLTVSPNLVLTTAAPSMAMTTWVRELSKPEYYAKSVFKKEIARIHTARLTTLFDAFKKVSPVLKHLLDEQDSMLPKVESIKSSLLTAESTVLQLDAATMLLIDSYRTASTALQSLQSQNPAPQTTTAAAILTTQAQMDGVLDQILGNVNSYTSLVGQQGDDLANAMEFISMVKFLDDFFSLATYRKIFDRLKAYPTRFSQTVLDIEKPLSDFCDQADGPKPYERVVAAQRLVEAIKLKQLDQNHPDGPGLAHLKALADSFESTLKPLANYLRTSEVHDYTLLTARNTRFLVSLEDMRRLSRQYERIVASYDAGGAVKEMLAVYGRVQTEIALSSQGVMAQITRAVRSAAVVSAEGTVVELSRGQISSAISGVTAVETTGHIISIKP